jgi:dipeptidyl-peptidase-4
MFKTLKMATSFTVIGLLLSSFEVCAQKQLLSERQIFELQQAHRPIEAIQWADDNSFVFVKTEDDRDRMIYLLTIPTKEVRQINVFEKEDYIPAPKDRLTTFQNSITHNGEVILTGNNRNPVMSPDRAYIAYTRDNDLYTLRLSDKKEFRLTDDGSDVILNGYASWVYMEEILGRSTAHKAFWWSPDSKTIAFFRTDDSNVPKFSITDSPGKHGYIETMRYPKAGDENPEVRIGFVDPEKNAAIVWAEFDRDEDRYFGEPLWTPSGANIWIQWLNRGQDDYRIFDTDIRTGAKREIYRETQSTWIDIDRSDRVNFLPSGKGAIIISDRSGYPHLYLHSMDGTMINPVTQGDFTVLNIVSIDERNRTVYFNCFKDNVGCTDFYRVSFDGTNLRRLSFGNYTHRVSLSPNAKYFVTTYSNVQSPPVTALYTSEGEFVMEINNSRNEANEIYEWAKTEFVTVESDDHQYRLPMRIVRPVRMEKNRKYPVIINVYGGPAAVNVRQGWASDAMKTWYAYEGLIQVSLDHRGSLHFGKKGQNEMHRNLGQVEVVDYTTCVKWLIENAQVDPERVCITGFSYGGYITCYSMLCAPDVFTHGIAGGSVTDWMLYDAPYTERFMDHPDENPEGYRRSSTLVHADKLKGRLLITHGLCDENVHVQNTFQLVDALEEYNRQFDLMIYPSSRHGYRSNKALHFKTLQMEFIYEHLLRKPVPKDLKDKI